MHIKNLYKVNEINRRLADLERLKPGMYIARSSDDEDGIFINNEESEFVYEFLKNRCLSKLLEFGVDIGDEKKEQGQ